MKTMDLRKFNRRPCLYDEPMIELKMGYPRSLARGIKNGAKKEGISASQFIRFACQEYLKK